MAATAASAIVSSFSYAIHTPKCTTNRVPQPLRTTRLASSSSSLELFTGLLRVSASSRRGPEVSAAAADLEQETSVAEEEEEEEAVVDEEVADEGVASLDTKLYFGNLPYSVDSSELARIIQDYAVPELIEVVYDRESGRSKGYGFVVMTTIEDADKVIENLDGMELMGRPLRVNFANKPREKVPLYPETEYRLFVGNLTWSATADTLKEEFQKYGNVVGTRVVYDGETGKSRGYGFVSFSSREEMEAALEGANKQKLEGREMLINLAEPRKQRVA